MKFYLSVSFEILKRMTDYVIILPLTMLILIVQGVTRIDPLVDTNMGLIRGLTATDGDYSMFLGIPYAKVDDDNPFGPSVPHPKFDKEFEAFDDSDKCPQIEENIPVGTLDCLHLNIYVPDAASSRNRLPVMVFIYGGNFDTGYAGRYLYGPKYIVRHDVILLTINYRLGPYGFLCLDVPQVPGNQGLKDQLLALRWIRDNIESFGGDGNKITLFGESAGARSVDLHLLSPQEKLYNNVIMESGTSLIRDTILEGDSTLPLKIAEELGFSTNVLTEALFFLTTVESKLVIGTASSLGLVFKPCIEKNFTNIERLIAEHPVQQTNVPKANDIPILIGYNNNEQVARYADKDFAYFDDLNVIYDRLIDNFDFDGQELNQMEEIVRHFYIGDEKINAEVMWELIDFDSDFTYNHPTERSIKIYLDNAARNVYYYVFSYTGGRNYYKDNHNVTDGGASHYDEIGYLFDMAYYRDNDPSPEDKLIIDRITTLWTNFAKYNDPTPELTELLPVKWEAVAKDVMNYMNIDTEISVQRRPFSNRMAFWDLFYELNSEFQKGLQVN